MSQKANPPLLLKANLKQLRLPTMLAEFEPLAREAGDANQAYEEYLLRLTELEVATRQANALKARIKQAAFPVEKDFDTFDFSTPAAPPKQKILELARGAQRYGNIRPARLPGSRRWPDRARPGSSG